MNKNELLKQDFLDKGFEVNKFTLMTSEDIKNLIKFYYKKYKSISLYINNEFYNFRFGNKRINIPKNKINYKLDLFIKTLL